MKFERVEHYDDFSDTVVFWVDVSDVPEWLRNKAKAIDKENYNESCFGFCINLDTERQDFCVVTDAGNNIYYVDIDGDKHWFKVDVLKSFESLIFRECLKELECAQKNCFIEI